MGSLPQHLVPIVLESDGTLLVPTRPGIGVEPNEEAIQRYLVA